MLNGLPNKKGGDIVYLFMSPTTIYIYNVSYSF